MFCSSLPPVVCRRADVLFTLFVFHYIRCPHILHCIFLCLVYPMFSVSPDCPFLIDPSVFSNVFLFSKIDKIYLVTIVIQRAKTFLGKYKLHQLCNGQCARLACGRLWVQASVRSNQRLQIGICCFSIKQIARVKTGWLGIMIKCPSEASCLPMHGLLFQ